PAEVAAQLLRPRIHRFALRDLLEVTALSNLDEQRIGARLGLCLRRGRSVGSNDDLSERDRRRSLLEIRATLLERSSHLFIGDVDGFCLLAQLGERLLLEVLPAILLDESLSIFLRRAESGVAELGPLILVGSELPAGLLD